MKVENLDHLGIVARLIDEIGIVELLNERLGYQMSTILSGNRQLS
jgi:hypothetical protein